MAFNFLHPPPNFDSIIEHAEKGLSGDVHLKASSTFTPIIEEAMKKIGIGEGTPLTSLKVSGNFQKYFTNINSTIESVYKTITYTGASTSMQQPGKTMQIPVYSTTSEVNSIQNPVNGMVIYDTEADKFKFREGGTWVVK